MTAQVYGIGYSGKSQDQIRQIADQLDAVVFDIRFSPRSRNPEFSGARLRTNLGTRYLHVKAFGNRNYRGGPIEFVDFEAGLAQVVASDKPVILMCMCKDPARCHRTVIGELLRQHGIQYTELSGSTVSSGRIARQERLL